MFQKQSKAGLRNALTVLLLAALGAAFGALVGQGIGGDQGSLVVGLLMAILVVLMAWLGVFRKKPAKAPNGGRKARRRRR